MFFLSFLHLSNIPSSRGKDNPGVHPEVCLFFQSRAAETHALVDSELPSSTICLANFSGFFGFRTYRVGCGRQLYTRLGMGAFVSFFMSCRAPSLIDLTNPSSLRPRSCFGTLRTTTVVQLGGTEPMRSRRVPPRSMHGVQ